MSELTDYWDLEWLLGTGIPLLPLNTLIFPFFSWWMCLIYINTSEEASTHQDEFYGWCIFNPWIMLWNWLDYDTTDIIQGTVVEGCEAVKVEFEKLYKRRLDKSS